MLLPEGLIGGAVDSAIRVVSRPTMSKEAISSLAECWKCLHCLSFRFSHEQALRVLNTALRHPRFSVIDTRRGGIIRLVTGCVRMIRDYDWTSLANQVLPLAKSEKFIGDFDAVLDLLATVARRSSAAKELIGNELLPKGTATSDLNLLKRIPDFGRSYAREQAVTLARAIAASIESQVLVGDAEPTNSLTSYGCQQLESNGQKIRVAMSSGAHELELLRSFGTLLDSEVLEPLVAPLLRTIQHPFNTAQNRLILMSFLFHVRTHLSSHQAMQACEALLPFANGSRADRSPCDMSEESTMARFKVVGTPTLFEQRGTALIALVFIASKHSSSMQEFSGHSMTLRCIQTRNCEDAHTLPWKD